MARRTRKVMQALYNFWSGFEIPAYVENHVPDEVDGEPVKLPYITYSVAIPDVLEESSIYARVWYRDSSFADLADKVDEISEAIGTGLSIPVEGGYIVINKDSLFSQDMPVDDPDIKVTYLTMILNAYV